MPVRKFRSVAEMPSPPPLPPLSVDAIRSACELMELASRLFPVRKQPGVRKFHTLEEANHYRDAWLREQIRIKRDKRNSG